MTAVLDSPPGLIEALARGIPSTRHVLVVRCDDGRIVYANPVSCAALGYSAEELTTRSLGDLHDEFDLELIERRHGLHKGVVDDGELRLQRSDGRDLWLGLYALPHPPVDGCECRVLIGREIVEQVRRRVENEGRMQALYRGQAIAEYDLEGHLIFANDLFLSLIGGTLTELLGTPHQDIADVGFSSRQEHDAWWQRICLGEVGEGERCYIDSAGREVWLREVFNPIFGPDGRPCKVLQAGLDVTHARLAQSRLQDSINYASQIQRALHEPSLRELAQSMPGSHALQWEPRDTVGGDCLFARELSGGLWFCLFDCTGHGAPGALLASIVLSETDRILSAGHALSPGDVISRLNRRIKESLGQTEANQSKSSDDGLDAVVIRIDPVSASVRVASSGIPVFVVEPGSPTQILRGNSGGIGYRGVPFDRQWETRTVNMSEQTRLFAATDGIFDQPGGPSGVGYGRRRFAGSLAAHASLPVTEQMVAVIRDFREYQGLQARRDDIAVAGLQLPRT